jgi:tryptophanyl-tRNA synthetase
MTAAVAFNEDYYDQVLHEHGYRRLGLRDFDFSLAGLTPATLNCRYLCHDSGDAFALTPAKKRAVTTGFGMSGVPHLATISHILKMIELQKGGETCQIVLGDLDAYNGKAKPYAEVTELAAQFGEYVKCLGFDDRAGTLRTQEGHLPALEAMYLLGRYVDRDDFDRAEEDNHAYYAARGIVDETMTYRRALSLSLMAADFIALGQDYDAVLVMLGLDEHRYVRFAQQAIKRFDQGAPIRGDFALSAVYTRMVKGFSGHPKFSKSIPGSAIDVDTAPAQVLQLLASEPADPAESATYQLMCQLPRYDAEQTERLAGHCLEGGAAWSRAVSDLTDYILDLTRRWPR